MHSATQILQKQFLFIAILGGVVTVSLGVGNQLDARQLARQAGGWVPFDIRMEKLLERLPKKEARPNTQVSLEIQEFASEVTEVVTEIELHAELRKPATQFFEKCAHQSSAAMAARAICYVNLRNLARAGELNSFNPENFPESLISSAEALSED